MKQLRVELGNRSYPILIGERLLDETGLLKQYIRSSEVMIVTNETIAPLYLERVKATLDGLRVETCIIPDGEAYKTLDVMNDIITQLLENHFSRSCCLVALGGGVVGDITGFAAASYQRGVDYIQVPTTVLAQVDSSVGGKTAVNHPLGKNMIGAFYQPRAVVADVGVLKTLDARELSAGIAEIIKYGLIRDADFFSWLEDNMEKLVALDREALTIAIEKSCQTKADIVAQDERESGMRALLNLGHTFGHAIETGLGYRDWLHGEAVGAGMLMAADLSCRQGWLSDDDVIRIGELLQRAKLPTSLPEGLGSGRMLELMSVDKKVRDGVLYLVLLQKIGHAIVTNGFDPENLQETLEYFSSGRKESD